MSGSEVEAGAVRRSSFSSSDEAEITDFIRTTYADNSTRFAPMRHGARFSARTHDVPALGADRLRTSIDYSGTSEKGFADLVFFLVHAGSVQIRSGGTGTTAGPGDVALFPLRVPLDFVMRSYDVSTLRLPVERVAQAGEDRSGPAGAAVVFHGTRPVSAAMHRYWRSLAGLAGAALADPESPLGSPLLAEDLARTLVAAALRTFPNTTMTQEHVPGPGEVAPATVRRAVAHIDAHAHEPLRLGDIAAASGTSARALQYGFRRHLGTTPLGYLRRVRLELARKELQRADPSGGATVAAVARRWGFANAGRFAAAYRAAYGVPPGRTLRD